MSNNNFNWGSFKTLLGATTVIGGITGAAAHYIWTKPDPSVQEYADCIRRCRNKEPMDEYNDWVDSCVAPLEHKFYEPCEHYCARRIISKQE